jgi:hypothetical protein
MAEGLKTVTFELEENKIAKEYENEEARRKKEKIRIIINSILLVVLLLLIARVPYIGSYPDSFLGEFMFGVAKYVLYLCLFLLFISNIFRNKLIHIHNFMVARHT